MIFFTFKCHSKLAQNFNPIELILTWIMMCCSTLIIFFLCEFGGMARNQFEFFADELHQCNWYAFPIGMQQLLFTFIANTQRPAIFRGYGGVHCSRDTFKTVENQLNFVNDRLQFSHQIKLQCIIHVF